jgi:hypothetical protein
MTLNKIEYLSVSIEYDTQYSKKIEYGCMLNTNYFIISKQNKILRVFNKLTIFCDFFCRNFFFTIVYFMKALKSGFLTVKQTWDFKNLVTKNYIFEFTSLVIFFSI